MTSRTRIKCTTLLVCHDVIHDSKTGNVHLIGVGNKLRPKRYPARTPGYCAFAVLSGVKASDTVVLVCSDQEDTDIFATPVHRVESPGRNEHRLVFRIQEPVFPRPGNYRLQCFVNEFLVSEIVIVLPPLEGISP